MFSIKTVINSSKPASSLRMFSTAAVSVQSLGSVKREDVLGASDPKWVGSFAKAVMETND